MTERGARLRALFPLCAMANSSCAPNLTSVMRQDGSLALVASRDIATGEEMTVCYTGTRSIVHSSVYIQKYMFGAFNTE